MINPRARPATKLWKVQLNFSQLFLQAHTAAGFEGVLNHFVHFFVLFVAEQKGQSAGAQGKQEKSLKL